MQAEKHLGKTNPKHIWFFSAQVIRKTCSFLQMGVCAGTCALAWLLQPGDRDQPPLRRSQESPHSRYVPPNMLAIHLAMSRETKIGKRVA